MVGLGTENGSAAIDNVTVQRLAPTYTFTNTEDFSTAPALFPESSGAWALSSGRYIGTASASTPAIDLAALNIGSNYLLDMSGTFKTSAEGGFVFDLYSPTDYKYVTVSAGKITLGHRTAGGFVTDAVYNSTGIALNTDEAIGLKLKGTTISVTRQVGTATSTVISFVYNGVLTDGGFGTFSRTGATSFDTVTVKTDDPNAAIISTSGGLAAAVADQASVTVDWDAESADLMAALGMGRTTDGPASPVSSHPRGSKEGITGALEFEPADETAWYVEV